MSVDFRKLEEESIQTYLLKCEAEGRRPDTDRFVQSLRGFQKIGAEVYANQASALHGNHKGFSAESLRAQHLLDNHNQWVKTQRTPYANHIVRTGPDEDFDMLVGSFESTWASMELQKGVSWMLEVKIVLSPAQRNRVFKIMVLSPHIKKPDMSVKTLREHLENMQERTQFTSRLCATYKGFLEEHQRFDEGFFDGATHIRREHNYTVNGLIRRVQDIINTYSSPTEGPITGNPMVRFHLDESYGLVLRGRHFQQEAAMDFLTCWLWDIVKFTEYRNRWWDWNHNMYLPNPPKETGERILMKEIYRDLRKLSGRTLPGD